MSQDKIFLNLGLSWYKAGSNCSEEKLESLVLWKNFLRSKFLRTWDRGWTFSASSTQNRSVLLLFILFILIIHRSCCPWIYIIQKIRIWLENYIMIHLLKAGQEWHVWTLNWRVKQKLRELGSRKTQLLKTKSRIYKFVVSGFFGPVCMEDTSKNYHPFILSFSFAPFGETIY